MWEGLVLKPTEYTNLGMLKNFMQNGSVFFLIFFFWEFYTCKQWNMTIYTLFPFKISFIYPIMTPPNFIILIAHSVCLVLPIGTLVSISPLGKVLKRNAFSFSRNYWLLISCQYVVVHVDDLPNLCKYFGLPMHF